MSLLDLCMDAVGVRVLRVAVYARVSTDEQASGTSLDDQEYAGRGWVVAQGDAAALHGVYRDDCSGTTDDRPEWLRLLADVRAGLVDVIVFTKWDRWSREVYVGEKMRRDVEPYGVRLVCLTLDVEADTPEGDMMIGQSMLFAAYDKKNIVRRCAQGQHGTAARGFWPGGAARYGYRKEGTRRAYVLAPDVREDGTGEADVLRHAYGLVTNTGTTYEEAAASLNAAGMTRRDGRAWDGESLRRCLTDPTITGRFTWAGGKDTTGRWGEPKHLTFPGVLTDSEYAQLARAEHKDHERHFYLLSGRLTAPCGAAHGGMYRNDRDLRQYRCEGKRWHTARTSRTGPCDCAWLHADTIEGRVWQAVAEFLSDAERMNSMAADYLGLRSVQQTVQRDELADVRRHAATLERAITSTLVEYARQGIDPAATAAATRALHDELQAVRDRETAILSWQADADAEEQRVRTLAEIATCARDRLATLTDDERAEVLAALGIRVTVLDNTKTPALAVEGRLAWLDLHSTLVGNPTEGDL